jgi:hypothetical protein
MLNGHLLLRVDQRQLLFDEVILSKELFFHSIRV